MHTANPAMNAVREHLRPLGSPVVVFCKSHSGSRLLAQLIEQAGVYMGARQNESSDSLDLLELVKNLVELYYPDYSPLWNAAGRRDDVASTAELARKAIADHLKGRDSSSRSLWGWKLCETLYVLPVIDFLFPEARYIHLIRDGRDVAFCNHTSPNTPFWKKIYFNTDRMERWRGYRLRGFSPACAHRHRRLPRAGSPNSGPRRSDERGSGHRATREEGVFPVDGETQIGVALEAARGLTDRKIAASRTGIS